MRAASLVLAALLLAGCGTADVDGPSFGEANGTFDTEIFIPGSNPPNYGDAVIEVVMDGEPRTLAQGASVVAIDADGLPTIDPDAAVYFALQAFQYTSETRAEVFELRVAPESWTDDTDVPVNTVDADALFGIVEFDANGQQVGGEIVLAAIRGQLHISVAGREPADEVVGTLSGVEMTTP